MTDLRRVVFFHDSDQEKEQEQFEGLKPKRTEVLRHLQAQQEEAKAMCARLEQRASTGTVSANILCFSGQHSYLCPGNIVMFS